MVMAKGKRWMLTFSFDGTKWFWWAHRSIVFTNARFWRVKPFTFSVVDA